MKIDNIMDNLLEKMLDGDFKITKHNKIPDTKLVVIEQNSSKWWVQVPTPPELGLPHNRKRLSTGIKIEGKKSFLEACRFGLRLIYKNEILETEGMPLFELKPTVKSIALKVIEEIKNLKIKKKTHTDYIRVIEKEIIPQLGNLYFKDLGIRELKEFFNNKKAKSSTRITITKTAFEKMFDYAIENKIIQQRDKPELNKIKIEKEESEEKVIFRESDFELINSNINSFIDESPKAIVKETRILFKFYMNFLKTTGIRAGKEATGIKWKDLFISKSNKERMVISVKKGKMEEKKKSREIAIDKETIENLINLLRFKVPYKNEMYAKVLRKDHTKSPIMARDLMVEHKGLIEFIKDCKIENEYIFSRKDKKIPTYESTFAQFKNFIDDRFSDDNLTLYSYRHYFITDRLLNNVEIYKLAKYCGNSVEMIEKHYSKVTSRLASEHVIKDLNLDIFKI